MPKTDFAPIPVRALGDKRLTGAHLRALGAIAWHDRLSASRKQGQGCWAGNPTLARECGGMNLSTLSTAITELATWGYITRDKHPLNKRLRVYRVIYAEVGEVHDADRHHDDDHLPAGKQSNGGNVTTVCPEPNGHETIVCPPLKKTKPSQSDRHVEYIPRKRKDTTLKSEYSSSEEASPMNGDDSKQDRIVGNVGGQLAIIERGLKRKKPITDDQLKTLSAWLYDVHADDHDETISQWAGRLYCEVDYLLSERGLTA